jgi:hypothetical protein
VARSDKEQTMSSVAESSALDQAIAAVDEAIQQIGVLSITTHARYSVLLNALKGFGNLDDARYNFAMEAGLLADAHKQWKLAADALEREIALDPPDTTGDAAMVVSERPWRP